MYEVHDLLIFLSIYSGMKLSVTESTSLQSGSIDAPQKTLFYIHNSFQLNSSAGLRAALSPVLYFVN